VGQLIILCGPSCAGKTPLKKAFSHFFPDLYENLIPLILYNSRSPRPGEKNGVDFFFRDYDRINQLRHKRSYALISVHNDLQAINLIQLRHLVKNNDVFYEGNTRVGRFLQTEIILSDLCIKSVFLSPLSAKEITQLKQQKGKRLQDRVEDLMRTKIIRRADRLGIKKDDHFFVDTNRRAADAFWELKEAWHFDHIIPAPDGEESTHWSLDTYPVAAAGETLEAFVAILQNNSHPLIEIWDENLIS